MTAASAPVRTRSLQPRRRPGLAAARLARLELRHNAMLWMLPVTIGLFWFISYRKIMAAPPLWYVRASAFQTYVVVGFIVPVVGAAAWMGSREARRHVADLITTSARPRWARLLVTWAATTTWALLGYLICLAVVYGVTAHQATWGGALWWPAAVVAASLLAYSAIGFAAGTLLPHRLTAPVVAIVSFFAVVLSTELITGSQSYWQISPVVSGPWDAGQDPGIATFYPYVPDLSIAQVMLLGGLAVIALAVLSLPASGRGVRAGAAIVVAAGMVAAATAVRLAGTGTLDSHGQIAIPALHDAATDRPIRFTPVCTRTAIPVCLNPAFAVYKPAVAAALAPVLSEIAGLPGAPVRIGQVAAAYKQGPHNSVGVGPAGLPVSGGEYHILLPDQIPNPPLTVQELAGQVRSSTGSQIIATFLDLGRGSSPAQQAVAAAMAAEARVSVPSMLAIASPPVPRGSSCVSRTAPCAVIMPPRLSTAAEKASRRFAALPSVTQHAWLVRHLPDLRAGRITLAQLP